MKKLFALLALVVLTGCEPSDQEIHQFNTYNTQNPETLGKLPDGRTLYCLRVINDHDKFHEHFIYFFSTNDTKTVSVNYTVPQGKTSYQQVIVLDGQIYELNLKKVDTAEEIR